MIRLVNRHRLSCVCGLVCGGTWSCFAHLEFRGLHTRNDNCPGRGTDGLSRILSLGREIWVAWEDPTAMSPRAERIGTEPAPQGRSANLSYQPLCDHLAPNLAKRESRERQLQAMWKFSGQSLNLDDDAGGKRGRDARPEVATPGQEAARGRIACATC